MLRLIFPGLLLRENPLIEAFGVSSEIAMLLLMVAGLISASVGYVCGSVNGAIVVSHTLLRRDIRAHGSRNAGTTNMLRTYGAKYAVLTMVVDMLKAVLATLAGYLLGGCLGYALMGAALAGFFCVLGHMFPIFYRFRGGKGVATTAMVALMLDPWTFLTMLLVFVAVVAMTRFVSLASVLCAFLYPLLLRAFCPDGWVILTGIATTAFVVFMHRENLKRLYHGKESKISFGKKKTAEQTESKS